MNDYSQKEIGKGKVVDLISCLQSTAALIQRKVIQRETEAEQRSAQQKNTNSSWKGKNLLSKLTGKQKKFNSTIGIKIDTERFNW